jgi:hypothetical protein
MKIVSHEKKIVILPHACARVVVGCKALVTL